MPEKLKAWRAPDQSFDDWALWWGPTKEHENAESMVEVEGTVVREYTFLGGYIEDLEDGDWSVQEVDLEWVDQPTLMRLSGYKKLPSSPRKIAAIGVEYISNYGGEERQIDSSELPV